MAVIKRRGLGINVVEAANQRIKNLFKSGVKVYLAVSGGKDSIVMMDLLYKLVVAGEIDPKQLEVQFIDEEAIYDCVVAICMEWRKKFMLVGVKYTWFCVEHRNFNCLHSLEDDENFIPWDRYQRDKWVRPMPPFAVTNTPYLDPRNDTYQNFLSKNNADGITITGVRCAESINRLYYIAEINKQGGMTRDQKMYPIYDWKDGDVWKYIKDNGLNFPEVYQYMWEAGVQKKQLRVCNFFSIDTCRSLSKLYEYYPDLAERVQRREPNAYLVQLYWDTNMFHRSSKTKRELEKDEVDDKDYRKLLIDLVNHPEQTFKNPHYIKIAGMYRSMILKHGEKMKPEHWKDLYVALMAGDTKTRTLRAITTDIVRTTKGGFDSDYK